MAPRLCDYCRLQRLKPSEIFENVKGVCLSCGTKKWKIPGYSEAHALPKLNIKQHGKTRSWHANVPTAQLRTKQRAIGFGLSFDDPIKGTRDAEAQGDLARDLLKKCSIDCVYHYPAPFRLVLFDLAEGASASSPSVLPLAAARAAARVPETPAVAPPDGAEETKGKAKKKRSERALGDVVATIQYDVLKRYINAVAVDERWRRKGISRFLISTAMAHIKDMMPLGAEKPISLYVTAKNSTDQPFLVDFYRDLGFHCDGDFGEMKQRLSGDAVPAVEAPEALAKRPSPRKGRGAVDFQRPSPHSALARQISLPQLGSPAAFNYARRPQTTNSPACTRLLRSL